MVLGTLLDFTASNPGDRNMSGCCDNDCAADALREKQRGTLIAVLAINAVMFVVILIGAQLAGSTALFADCLDNLGDAMTYGLSLMVVASSTSAKAKVALFKGSLILLAALVVTGQITYKLFNPEVPVFALMGAFSLLALAANSICLGLLWQHRNQDINMSSVWECSRNDIATNISVFVAAGAVWLAGSGWPDIVVAGALVGLLLRSSARVISGALREIRVEAHAA
ncbi:MAG: Co/Zn/Cd efflux system component [Candidatus Azotimanducaceae bacterium]|jgi:Co/Zn/Cd efflux system component